MGSQPATRELPLGFFGASTGAAAALEAAAGLGDQTRAVVSRGGRPDLASEQALLKVTAPTLLLVGGYDDGVIDLNQLAYDQLHCEKEMVIVPGATHLFEEPGTLEEVARQAAEWFAEHLSARPSKIIATRPARFRHCERSEESRIMPYRESLDCRVAPLLAMTRQGGSPCTGHPTSSMEG